MTIYVRKFPSHNIIITVSTVSEIMISFACFVRRDDLAVVMSNVVNEQQRCSSKSCRNYKSTDYAVTITEHIEPNTFGHSFFTFYTPQLGKYDFPTMRT